MESCPTQAVLPLVGLAAETIVRDRYISGGWIFPGGTLPDASRPPVGRTRGGESHPRPAYNGASRGPESRRMMPFTKGAPVLGVVLVALIATAGCSRRNRPADRATKTPSDQRGAPVESDGQQPAGGDVRQESGPGREDQEAAGQTNGTVKDDTEAQKPSGPKSDLATKPSRGPDDAELRERVFKWLEQMSSQAAVERREASEALDALGEAAMPVVVSALRDGSMARKRGAAVYLIGRVSPGNEAAAAALIEALDADDPALRHAALQGVEKLAAPRLADALPSLLSVAQNQEESEAYRSRAIRAITKLGPTAESATNQITQLARNDRVPLSVRRAAFFALVKVAPNEGAETFFRSELQSNAVPDLRRLAAKWLADVASSDTALDGLVMGLNDPVKTVRLQAVDSLVKIGKPALPVLIEALESSEVQTRRYATLAIGKLGLLAADAVPALESRLNDPDKQVRELAQRVLERLDAGGAGSQ
ncbi:MAG: HEAT repeat domain-containing protein [Planctomycetota bacterium]